jgi:hypothetical protein
MTISQTMLSAILAIAVTIIHGTALGAHHRIVCPKVVPSTAMKLDATIDGWRTYSSLPLKLNSAAPTGGPPEQHADFAEFTTKTTKAERIDQYDLRPPHPGGLWMKCGYGASNEITLHKQIDDSISQCTITHQHKAPSEIDIVCR